MHPPNRENGSPRKPEPPEYGQDKAIGASPQPEILAEMFAKAFAINPAAIGIVDLDNGFIIDVNESWEAIFGYSRDEALGHSAINLHLWPRKEDRDRYLNELLEKGSFRDREYKVLRKSGESFECLCSAELMTLGDKKFILSTWLDISEHRRAEEEKAKLTAQLQQAQKMESVGRLAGGVAHDFNNMLGVILGHAEMALEQVDPAQPIHDDLSQILKAGRRSADLTRQLLVFARKQTVVPKVLDMNETIAGMLKMLERMIGENILLDWQPAANLWPVKMDPSQIDQILANLCVNSRDAISDVGRITIETGNCTLGEDYCTSHQSCVPGEYVRLVVRDNGSGMDRQTLSHVFEPFFTTKQIGIGTGLGLATVYGAVKQNSGFIYVDSELGMGTTITIYLPRQKVETAQPQAEEAVSSACDRGTILLVEDELAILEMTTKMLMRQGHTVLVANNAAEAIRLATGYKSDIHLLMTDVIMPEMNGRSLAQKLLSLYPHLNCLFMSGYTADVIAPHGVLEPRTHFLQKPFSMRELVTAVQKALAESSTKPELKRQGIIFA